MPEQWQRRCLEWSAIAQQKPLNTYIPEPAPEMYATPGNSEASFPRDLFSMMSRLGQSANWSVRQEASELIDA
jgi:hypothetical protein